MNVRKIPANTPQIQYFGRWEKSLDACRCAQGATYIKANFTGRLLLADLTDPGNWWRVSIDESPFRRFRPQGENTLLAENLSAGRHKVLLVRSTEGYIGISEFRGFFLERSETLLPPDPPKPRCLEFIGDSITAGAKNDGPPDAPYDDIEDNDMAYGPQLAECLAQNTAYWVNPAKASFTTGMKAGLVRAFIPRTAIPGHFIVIKNRPRIIFGIHKTFR